MWLRGRSERPQEEAPLTLARSFAVPADARYPEMVVAQGDDPRALVRKALEGLGGIRRFISRGDVVVIKPNIGWDRTPEQAANTNPLAVAEMVRQCLDAGAKKVIVTDVSCNEPHRCFPAQRHCPRRRRRGRGSRAAGGAPVSRRSICAATCWVSGRCSNPSSPPTR